MTEEADFVIWNINDSAILENLGMLLTFFLSGPIPYIFDSEENLHFVCFLNHISVYRLALSPCVQAQLTSTFYSIRKHYRFTSFFLFVCLLVTLTFHSSITRWRVGVLVFHWCHLLFAFREQMVPFNKASAEWILSKFCPECEIKHLSKKECRK